MQNQAMPASNKLPNNVESRLCKAELAEHPMSLWAWEAYCELSAQTPVAQLQNS